VEGSLNKTAPFLAFDFDFFRYLFQTPHAFCVD